MIDLDRVQTQIDEIESQITDLDGRIGVMIRLQAGLSPEKDGDLRHNLDLKIDAAIRQVSELRSRLTVLTGDDNGALAALD